MAVIKDTATQWTIVDPTGLRHQPKPTETAGVVVGTSDNGYFTTSRPEVAAELAEKYPHMLITKHEAYAGDKARRTVNFTIPRLPGEGWMSEAERKAARQRKV